MAHWLLYCAVLLLCTEWSSKAGDNCIGAQQSPVDHLAEQIPDPGLKQNFGDRWANLTGELQQESESETFEVDGTSVFEDSFKQLRSGDATFWRSIRILVHFKGENESGPVPTQKWYTAITNDILTPNRHLFKMTAYGTAYTIDPSCSPDEQCVDYFRFAGRIIAKAVSQQWQLPFYLTPGVYKHFLGKSVNCDDLESEQGHLYTRNSIKYITETRMSDVNAVFGYNLTFSAEVAGPNGSVEVDLVPSGSSIPVTDENKEEYLRLKCQTEMIGLESHSEAFRQGFYDVIPQNLLALFNEQELEWLISGMRVIDIDELKNNTEYKYCDNATQISWFWEAVGKLDQSRLAMFLRFVTGSPTPPINGFESLLDSFGYRQKFTIYCIDEVDELPKASDCVSLLQLPQYMSYEKLDHFLWMGIFHDHQRFNIR